MSYGARRLWNLWRTLKQQSQTAEVDFASIKSRILRSKPQCGPSVPYIYNFLLKFGGGAEAKVLLETESYVKAMGGSQRMLGASFWDNLGQDSKSGLPFLRQRHALLRQAYMDEKMNASDARRLLGVASQEVENIMQEVRGLAETMNSKLFVMILHWEQEAIRCLLDKKGKYKTVEHALQASIVQIHELGGPVLSQKWEAFAPDAKQGVGGASSSGGLTMRQYHEDGRITKETQMVQDMGFAVGDHVKRKDKTTAVVSGFTDDKVKLELDSNITCTVSAKSFLRKEWSKYIPRKEEQPIQDGHALGIP